MDTSQPTTFVLSVRHLKPGFVPRYGVLSGLIRAAAAVLCAITTLGAVLALFNHASADPWLQPTSALLTARAECDAITQRLWRERCVRNLVEQARNPDPVARQLAQR